MGIEPTYSAWEADVLPLNYTRIFALRMLFYHLVSIYASAFYHVDQTGFEPQFLSYEVL